MMKETIYMNEDFFEISALKITALNLLFLHNLFMWANRPLGQLSGSCLMDMKNLQDLLYTQISTNNCFVTRFESGLL